MPRVQLPQAERSASPHASSAQGIDFSEQLRQQMAALMGEADESPEMKKEIEAMMEELSAAADPGPKFDSTDETPGSTSSSTGLKEPFQETIRRTIERVQASGEQATAAAELGDEDDILTQMLKEIGGGDTGAAGGDEEFSKMLVNMMEQLTNKEILYDPMKELQEKFPAWMSKNRHHSDPDDLSRFEIQQRLIGEIVGKFEETTYSDSNVRDREYIVERMQQARLCRQLNHLPRLTRNRCKQWEARPQIW